VCTIYSLRIALAITKVSKNLGKAIKKDSYASDLPVCKETLDVQPSGSDNFHLRCALFLSRPAIT